MITLHNVTKLYGDKIGVQNLSLVANKGEILGLLGPNGAGKSTTMRMITGYTPPTSGKVEISGYDIQEQPLQVKRKLGYLPENPPLYRDMTVTEYLQFVGEIKGLRGRQLKNAITSVCEQVGLEKVMNRVINHLSRGYRQRVGLAQAIISDPEVLILDEPTSGLDPKQITEIRELIRELAANRTVILSSHILPEVSMLCQRVAIINKGQLVAEDSPENLARSLSKHQRLDLIIKGVFSEIINVLKSLPELELISVEESNTDEHKFLLENRSGQDLRADLFFAMAKQGFPILQMVTANVSLEEIFLQLVTDEPELPGTPVQ